MSCRFKMRDNNSPMKKSIPKKKKLNVVPPSRMTKDHKTKDSRRMDNG